MPHPPGSETPEYRDWLSQEFARFQERVRNSDAGKAAPQEALRMLEGASLPPSEAPPQASQP